MLCLHVAHNFQGGLGCQERVSIKVCHQHVTRGQRYVTSIPKSDPRMPGLSLQQGKLGERANLESFCGYTGMLPPVSSVSFSSRTISRLQLLWDKYVLMHAASAHHHQEHVSGPLRLSKQLSLALAQSVDIWQHMVW